MFQIGRFDPNAPQEKPSSNRKKRKSGDSSHNHKKKSSKNKKAQDHDGDSTQDQGPATTLRVIAPETKGALSSLRQLNTKISQEAFDDLDMEFVEGPHGKGVVGGDNNDPMDGDNNDNDNDIDIDADNNDETNTTSVALDPTNEIQRALYMSQLPLQVAAKRWGLAPFLVDNLQREGHKHFFPIQALVIPDVIVAERYSQLRVVRDVCVGAPTGSGKTLAFVLPVLNALSTRQICRLRALVVLPSRDLATQVHQVFEHYAKGSNLKIGLAIGQSDLANEQQQLMLGQGKDKDNDTTKEDENEDAVTQTYRARLRYMLDPSNFDHAKQALEPNLLLGDDDNDDGDGDGDSNQTMADPTELPAGGLSAVDVLVCTPGRLLDHCDNTPGFTLQHLRFLVIDEADRLLSQSYHGWIHRVFDNVHAASAQASWKGTNQNAASSSSVDPITWRRPEGVDTAKDGSGDATSVATDPHNIVAPLQLRKLLYSATLTKDPQKLASLKLINPKYFSAHHLGQNAGTPSSSSALYSMPPKLREYTVECSADQKPLVLMALLLERLREQQRQRQSSSSSSSSTEKRIIVVFTSSLDSTHRLTRLLQLLWMAAQNQPSNDASWFGELPLEFSSSLNQQQRSACMKRCNDPSDPINIIVCSDGMSRGMDIEFVGTVIHYDVPGFAKTYVHRCGRTARADRDGEAITLLKGSGQSGQFKKLRRLISHPERVQNNYKVATSLLKQTLVPLYRGCLRGVKALLEAEASGDLRPTDLEGLDEFISA
eukprot:Nitzschia sp. Nitz4//scaffold235_size30605//3561//5864//NITZ4_007971-RA/size30605-processed-gene-0.71-mRNA-1//1//CDS//3329543441//6127//frame0